MVRVRGVSAPPGHFFINTYIVSYLVLPCKCLAHIIRKNFWRFCVVQPLRRLKVEREKSRLTQEELALLSGVSRDAIARLETTSRRATRETARKLAKVLKVRPEDLT